MRFYSFLFFSIFLMTFMGCTEGRDLRTTFNRTSIRSALEKESPDKKYHLGKSEGSSVRLGDRNFIASHLMDIFGNSASEPISQNISKKLSLFGGPCDPHNATECPIAIGEAFQATVLPKSFSGREVLRIRTCDLILQEDEAVLFALKKANIITGSNASLKMPQPPEIIRLYDLFFPGISPDEFIVDSLYNLSQEVFQNGKNKSIIESWRFIQLTLCIAPDWQIL